AHHAVRGELREKAVQYLAQAGGRALARSALADARLWYEQALGVLESLPESRVVLEQAFEIRIELQLVLSLLAEIRQSLERGREGGGGGPALWGGGRPAPGGGGGPPGRGRSTTRSSASWTRPSTPAPARGRSPGGWTTRPARWTSPGGWATCRSSLPPRRRSS